MQIRQLFSLINPAQANQAPLPSLINPAQANQAIRQTKKICEKSTERAHIIFFEGLVPIDLMWV